MTAQTSPLYQTLLQAGQQSLAPSLLDYFAKEPQRAQRYFLSAGTLHIDLSKTHINQSLIEAAQNFWQASGAGAWYQSVDQGALVNTTERRAALHTAWRAPKPPASTAGGERVDAVIHETNAKLKALVENWRASDANAILHLGIGGSALGPELAIQALSPRNGARFDIRVVANIDAEAVLRAIEGLDPKRTRLILASKSWTTLETQSNAALLRAWFNQGGVHDTNAITAAITERTDLALESGLGADQVFALPAWVGGRYSLWSAIGLPLALQLGWEGLQALRAGAHSIDQHAQTMPLGQNAVFLSALAGWLYAQVAGYQSRAVFCYDQRLSLLPAHLAQLEMESLGKSVGLEGTPRSVAGAILWGGVGTDVQHAVFQAVHQGPTVVPLDMIGVRKPDHREHAHHRHLLANMLAQSAVLLAGKTAQQAESEMLATGLDGAGAKALSVHKRFPGNRPSTTLLLDTLTPESLGALIAFYEQRTVMQAALWGINPFDQWGVEMGKAVARQLADNNDLSSLDRSTQQLAQWLFAS
jgi:glucose-6-phosphate isomerase